MRWVERYKNEGNVNIHYRKPVAYKVKEEYVRFLVDEINKNKTTTLHELNQKQVSVINIPIAMIEGILVSQRLYSERLVSTKLL